MCILNNYYFENTNYQVLYMHDGHNLFSPKLVAMVLVGCTFITR